MQNKKNSIQVRANEHNQKVFDSALKNQKPFLVITEIYQFKFVNFLPIFGL